MRTVRTRRELAHGAAMSAGAAAGALLLASPARAAEPASDVRILERTLVVEQLIVIAYRHALASGKLDTKVGSLVREILGQEVVHVATLERALEALGAAPPAPPRDVAAAQRGLAARQVHASLTELPDQNACLRLLVDVETVAEGAYFEAISKLTDAALLRTSAAIMGSEAQHWTLLSAAHHHGDVKISVPYPFVGGSSTT